MSVLLIKKCNRFLLSFLFYSIVNNQIHCENEGDKFKKSNVKNTIDIVNQYEEKVNYSEEKNNSNIQRNAQPIIYYNITPPQPINPYQQYQASPILLPVEVQHKNNDIGMNNIQTNNATQNQKDKKKENKNIPAYMPNSYDYLDVSNDAIFSDKNYFMEFPYPKTWKSTTIDIIGMPAVMLLINAKNLYDNYEEHTNSQEKTVFSFLRDKLFSSEGISLWSLLGRSITSFTFEKKKVVCKHLAIGYSINHLIFPGFLLEVNTGYNNNVVFGASFRFGLDEPIKLSLSLKLGGFYLRINTIRIATIDLLYMFYNNGLKKSENNPTTNIWSGIFKKVDDIALTKYFYWDINNPLAEKVGMKDNTLFSMLFGGMSIGLGGIWSVD